MIHQYKNNGYYIILDVNSGSVHSADALLYDAVEILSGISSRIWKSRRLLQRSRSRRFARPLREGTRRRRPWRFWRRSRHLIDAEELFTADVYKNYVMDFKKRQTVVKALCLHIAHDCNLACQYCFAEEGEYHGRRALMSFEVGKKALDFLIANSGKPGKPGGGFLRRGAVNELGCGEAAGGIRPFPGGGMQ